MKRPTKIVILTMCLAILFATFIVVVRDDGGGRTWKSGETTVTLLRGGTLKVHGEGAMEDYIYVGRTQGPWHSKSKSITNLVIENGVTHIGVRAFSGMFRLKSVAIPGSVTSIGSEAFLASELRSVMIPASVTFIGGWAFAGSGKLESVTILGDVASIRGDMFWACTSLTSVTILGNVKEIGYDAFSGAIPDSVKKIGYDAFSSSRRLASIKVAMNNAYYSSEDGILFNKDKTTLILYPPGRLGSTYTIPNDVTTIEKKAFYGCIDLTSVTVLDGVATIEGDAFGNCTSLTSIKVAADNAYYSSEDGVLFNKDKTVLILYPPGRLDRAYMIPNSVTTIENRAFGGSIGLTSVTIPGSVMSIGDEAFFNCTGLASVAIPGSVTSLGELAFWGCTGLTSVMIEDGMKFIKRGAFQNCTNLTSVIIPGSVTTIEAAVFNGCIGLTSVMIPSSVTSIGKNAFFRCTRLMSIYVDEDNPAYSSVGGVLFNKAKDILIRYPAGKQEAYTIPNSVTTVEEGAFSSSAGLTSVTIGNSVKHIESEAFDGCTSLTSVTSLNPVPPYIGPLTFSGLPSSGVCFYVPASSINAYLDVYRYQSWWKDFDCIRAIASDEITEDAMGGVPHNSP